MSLSAIFSILSPFVPKNYKEFIGWAILTAAMIAATLLGYGTFIPPSPPIPVFATGWVPAPDEVKAIASQLKFPVFSDTEAGKSNDTLPQEMYLWQVYKKIDPKGPPCKNQRQVGSCVSFGTNNAILRTMACAIVLDKKRFELKDIVEEVTYAGSRVEIGGGKLGNGDGSVGAWAAQFVQKYGVVARAKYPSVDLSSYDESRCRSWGRSGVPSDIENVAREHPVQTITQVKTWDEAKRALANGYGIAVCSNQGFSMQRDSRGIARPQGNWGHCMCLDGYKVDGGNEYGHIENSWGPDAHTGPVGWGEPSTAGFWADSKTISRMLAANDSWAFSAVKGFPARKLDWFVRFQPIETPPNNRIQRFLQPSLFARLTKEMDNAFVLRN